MRQASPWIALAALLTVTLEGPAQAQPAAPACDVALWVLVDAAKQENRPVAFTSSLLLSRNGFEGQSLDEFRHRWVQPPPGSPESAYEEAYGWIDEPPSEELARRFLAGPGPPLLQTCPGLAGELKARRIAVDPKGEPRPRSGGLFRMTYIGLSLPLVSEGGLEAVLVYESVSGPLAGGGMLLHLRREPGGDWRRVGMKPTWIS
jgi:hypothetical protein